MCFSTRIRWLAVAVGLSAAALFWFLSPVAALVPAVLPLLVVLQPRLPDLGKRIVKWFVWIWAFGWSQGLVILCVLLLKDFPNGRNLVGPRISSLISTVLILWLDTELIIDGVGRIRVWRSTPAQDPRPIKAGLWMFAAALNLWIGWGLASLIANYHGVAGEVYALAMGTLEAAIVLVFDAYLIWRVLKLTRVRRVNLAVKDDIVKS
ncbi:MAG: hypothetical protein WBX38_12345 [Candidatus Sulfotelmatobacter sp.]